VEDLQALFEKGIRFGELALVKQEIRYAILSPRKSVFIADFLVDFLGLS
jgi:hypothetical protein